MKYVLGIWMMIIGAIMVLIAPFKILRAIRIIFGTVKVPVPPHSVVDTYITSYIVTEIVMTILFCAGVVALIYYGKKLAKENRPHRNLPED